MKNKKGFTLTELLCVIVILGLITTMVTTNVLSMSKKSNENMYCAKLEMLKSRAIEYASIYEKELNASTTLFEGYKSITINVQDLVDAGKFEADKKGMVINPINGESMNEEKIILYLKNNQIIVYINDNNVC